MSYTLPSSGIWVVIASIRSQSNDTNGYLNGSISGLSSMLFTGYMSNRGDIFPASVIGSVVSGNKVAISMVQNCANTITVDSWISCVRIK